MLKRQFHNFNLYKNLLTHLKMFHIHFWMFTLTWMTSKKIPGTRKLRTNWIRIKESLCVSVCWVCGQKTWVLSNCCATKVSIVWGCFALIYQAVMRNQWALTRWLKDPLCSFSPHLLCMWAPLQKNKLCFSSPFSHIDKTTTLP